MTKEYEFVEFVDLEGYFRVKLAGKMQDQSSYNYAIYRTDFTPLHDQALMLYMRVFGIGKAEDIKRECAMFKHITESAI